MVQNPATLRATAKTKLLQNRCATLHALFLQRWGENDREFNSLWQAMPATELVAAPVVAKPLRCITSLLRDVCNDCDGLASNCNGKNQNQRLDGKTMNSCTTTGLNIDLTLIRSVFYHGNPDDTWVGETIDLLDHIITTADHPTRQRAETLIRAIEDRIALDHPGGDWKPGM